MVLMLKNCNSKSENDKDMLTMHYTHNGLRLILEEKKILENCVVSLKECRRVECKSVKL